MIKALLKHKKYFLHPNYIYRERHSLPYKSFVLGKGRYKYFCCYFKVKLKKGDEKKEISGWFLTFSHMT